ncbi:hypothetical protein C3L23_05785 [Nautilia sp. PV-1]|uniref:hypothetical protein n=1 Tax=Nautilia sp. PV-1 TaxID=2579250 RepID=UPI000FDAADF5|nr:hypothetical protein [Nautilia sp. PV-1]AZV46800.1 hypothetical protein C3L23_05785 [Nautilia sp. PV-1]
MFEKKGEYYTNKDENFLKESDLVIYWNAKPKKLIKNYAVIGGSDEHSKVDVPRADKDLALLLARLAYVFKIYDDRLEDSEEFEDFVDVLKGVRVKTQIKKHLTTLEEISGVLYLMDNSEKISIIIEEIEEEEFEALMSFLVMMGFFSNKIGIFSKKDISYYDEFYFYE